MSETIETLQGLFEHNLKLLLWTERKLADEVLPELREVVHDEELRCNVEEHLHETRGHVENLERVFGLVNLKPEAQESDAVKGLQREHDEGMKLLSRDEAALGDILHAGAIARTEHAEIAAYKELIQLAEQLGDEAVAIALYENLEQEGHALRKAEQALKKLLREEVRA